MNAKIIGVNLLDSPLLLLAIVLLFELGFSSAEYECSQKWCNGQSSEDFHGVLILLNILSTNPVCRVLTDTASDC